MILKRSIEAKLKFEQLPTEARSKLSILRDLIIEQAEVVESALVLDESLKWGELSYKASYGSPIRINWSPKNPDKYSIYFNCQSSLISTIKSLYGRKFEYEKNRAIHLSMDDQLPAKELKICFALALDYHKLKHLPLLGQ